MANIVIMPGGFHPFHAGHAALYNSIKEKYGNSDVYVAASDNQKERPFPFKIKEKLAQISGVQPGEFVQVKSPFVPKEITDKYDPEKDSIVFVRSEKDRNEYPKTGMIKKDGSPGYFHSVDKGITEPFGKVGYIDYLPVKKFAGITSATQIRDAWPNLNDDQREDFVTQIYPHIANNKKLIKNVVKLLSQGMSLNEGLAYIDDKGNRVDYTRPDLPTDIRALVINWFNDRDRYTKATLKQKGYTIDIDDKFDNIDIVDKKGRKFTVKVDDAMNDLIQQAYTEPMNETFVDPDQSKQYWNHDAQKIGVGGQIEMPLTDKPNLNGRRQGFNEGGERSIIRDATIDALVNAFEGHEDEFESREAIEANIYKVLSDLNVEDIVDPKKEHGGQRMGNFASGRVIDVVDSGSVIDEVMQQINYFDPADDRNYVSEGVGKDIALGALTLGALAGGVGANDITYDDLFNKYYTAEIQKMEERGYNLTDRDADGYNPSLKRGARRIAKLKAQQEIQKLSPADSPIAKQIEKTRTELPQPNFDNYMPSRINESIDKIRGMIKETTDEQKSRSVDLHRKLFELMEEERDNISDLSHYRKQRQMQSNYLTTIENLLMGLHEEFAEMEQLKLMPVDLLDTFENIKDLIKYIQNYDPVKDNFPFPKDLLEKLQLKTVQLKEYFGGMRDRSAPRVLRKQNPKLDINSFWNTTDLTETADYIEEK